MGVVFSIFYVFVVNVLFEGFLVIFRTFVAPSGNNRSTITFYRVQTFPTTACFP